MYPKSIAVVGAGITGLAAARQVRQILPDARVILFETASQPGGFLQTENIGGYLVEHSADMFTTLTPEATQLCQELGKSGELISTRPVSPRAFVAVSGNPAGRPFLPVPEGFSLMLPNNIQAVLDSDLLDDQGSKRFLEEEHVPARQELSDESLASFAMRRYGKQVFDRMIQPLVSGIYTADPEKLSMQATLARFLNMERKYGSLIAAAKSNQYPESTGDETRDKLVFADQTASGARYDLFRAPRLGMKQMIQWLVDDLRGIQIRTQHCVQSIQPADSGWNVAVRSESAPAATEAVDGLILAIPAANASKLIQPIDASSASLLQGFETASCAIAILGFDETQLPQPFSGYGIVIPHSLKRKLIAVSCSSNKFAQRAPDGKMLFRCFVGGALQEELVDLPDEEILGLCCHELRRLLTIDGSPELARVFRWHDAMPQYHLGHTDRVSELEQKIAKIPGLELAGNSYHGVGIPTCIQNGQTAARRVVESLLTQSSGQP